MTETHVVTCFLRSGTDVLLLLRSEKVGSYAGRWGAVAGHAEGDPDEAADREIREETGFEHVDLVRRGPPFDVLDEALGKRWIVHPYLFDVPRRAPVLNRESSTYEWVSPTEILRRDIMPELWTAYRHVAPSLDAIRGDDVHGSAYLSLRAVEVLRDQAAELNARRANGEDDGRRSARPRVRPAGDDAGWQELRSLAESLLSARPAMAAVRNRLNRVMHEASGSRTAASVEQAADNVLDRAIRADDDAGAIAARLIHGKRVLTLSQSGTVIAALEKARADVIVAQSIPGGEGRAVAEHLVAIGLHVAMCSDAGIPAACDHVDAVLVGADTILPDGSVVNKVGTRSAALAASARSIPMYVTTSSDKIASRNKIDLEQAARETLYEGDARIHLIHPLFEMTPPELVTAIITEHDALESSHVADLVEALGRLESWRDR